MAPPHVNCTNSFLKLYPSLAEKTHNMLFRYANSQKWKKLYHYLGKGGIFMRQIITRGMTVLLLLLLSVFFAGSSYALPGVEVGARGYYWFSGIDGGAQTDLDPVKLDFKNDLGIKDEDIGSGELFLRWGRNHFIVDYSTISFHGTTTKALTFSGQTFNVNAEGTLDYDQIDGIYQFDFIKFNPVIAGFRLGVMIQVKYVDGFVEVKEATITKKETFQLPIPMIGLASSLSVLKNMVVIEARVAGIAYSGNRAVDGQLLAGFKPFPFFEIFGGYKIFDVKVDETSLNVDYTIDGPVAGIQLSF